MNKRIARWFAIYVATILAIVLVAKYPDILAGHMPHFTSGELLRTLFFAALGTGLVFQMKGELSEIKTRK